MGRSDGPIPADFHLSDPEFDLLFGLGDRKPEDFPTNGLNDLDPVKQDPKRVNKARRVFDRALREKAVANESLLGKARLTLLVGLSGSFTCGALLAFSQISHLVEKTLSVSEPTANIGTILAVSVPATLYIIHKITGK